MTDTTTDPYALNWGDYQDPYEHADDMCTGCDMCAPWEGKPYDQIRAERRDYVARRRAAATPAADRDGMSPADHAAALGAADDWHEE